MKTTQEKIAVMQAYADGKQIQTLKINKEWIDIYFEPSWNWLDHDYRIKPEPKEQKYRPYQSAEEVLEDMKAHGPMVKYSKGEKTNYFYVTSLRSVPEGVWCWIHNGAAQTAECILRNYTWQDGTPFGRKEE